MSVHRFGRQVRHTLGIDSAEQLVAAQRLLTDFLRVSHRFFVASGRNHQLFFAVMRDGVGIDAAGYLAASLSEGRHGQGQLLVPWPDDERNGADHRRLVKAMNMAVTDLYFHQDIFPVQNCRHAIELFLRDLMEASTHADKETEKPSYLTYFVIGDEAAFHLTGLLPEAQRGTVLDDLDFFTERLECFDRLVRGWENESTKELEGRSSPSENRNGAIHDRES